MAIKLFMCGHVVDEEKNTMGPYIYMEHGVDAPHCCMRCNGKDYVFAIDEKDVPAWFDGDKKITPLGELEGEPAVSSDVKGLLTDRLGFESKDVPTLSSVSQDTLFKKLLTKKTHLWDFNFENIKRRISQGRRTFTCIKNVNLSKE